MKHLVMFLLAIAFANKLSAQDVTYWVGRSTHPDPIIRHHEAFMEAFALYVKSTHSEENTCRMETVSSITTEGQEILTIAIGNGVLVEYSYHSSFSELESMAEDETLLQITYKYEAIDKETAATHKYYKNKIIIKDENSNQTGNVINSFNYECDYFNAE